MMWPQEYVELKHIEDLLVCGICYEFMDTSVITSCSHNYCSLCIRKYLHYKTQCPACFTETFEKDLRKNKVLDEIIAQFSQIKDKLKRCLQIQIQFAQCDKIDNVSNTPKSLHQSQNAHVNEENKIICNTSTTKINLSPSINVQKDVCSPSTSGRPKIPLMFTPKSYKRPIVTSAEDSKVVICPVCKVTVSETHINRHLDDCLKRESIKDRQQVVKSDRKPLPKLVFTLMKEVVIKKKLKEFGLSSHGDRRAMEARLQRYIVLYNAECDKSNPRSISELVKQCEDEENLEKKINRTTFLNKLQITRNTEQNIIDDERKKYLETHKDSFESLIKQIKSIDTPKKSSARRSLLKENIENNEDIPHKRQAVTENSDDSLIDTKHSDFQSLNSAVYIQDSDSDTSCPLQMYSSTDPKKFLNAELSPSNNNDSHNKSKIKYEEHNDIEEFNSSNLHMKISETEEYDSSDAFSDTSISSKQTQSIMENSFYRDKLKEDCKNVSNTSKYKKLLQKQKNLSLKNEMKYVDAVSTSMKDFDPNSTINEEEEEDEKSMSVLQDILCDLSSNDSTDSKLKYGKFYGFVNDSVNKSSNLEKENVSSSPERSGNYSVRKRTHDSMQNDNKFISSMKKKIKKSSYYQIETKESSKGESSSTLNDKEMDCLQGEPQLRKRLPKNVKETTVVRKSTRIKVKNN